MNNQFKPACYGEMYAGPERLEQFFQTATVH
jgi:hypothetical protein